MVQDAREGWLPYVATADVLVAIGVGGERRLGVVHVDHADVIEADGGVGFIQGALQALRRANVEAGGEKMRGVETDAGLREDAARAAAIEHLAEVVELRAEASSLPCGVFDQDAQGGGR